MRPEDFDFELPASQIAQAPVARRGDARMLVVEESVRRHRFARELAEEIKGWAGPRPLVVRNDSRVVPARVHGERDDGRRFELLVCDPAARLPPGSRVRAWVRGAKRMRDGDVLRFGPSDAPVALRQLGPDPVDSRARVFELQYGDLLDALETGGEVPLPPYVRREGGPTPLDLERYQTVYARDPGSVAAPTAGLHFDGNSVDAGLDTVEITLHVGPGTFLPMDVDDVEAHRVGSERIEVSAAAAARIEAARAQGRPILAVGTTVVRTLESVAARFEGRIEAWSGRTELVVTPGHRWQVVDHLLTNFHLPRSSLLMLVCSFGGRERVLEAYREAVAAGYRFYSYGDCMLVRGRGMPGSG